MILEQGLRLERPDFRQPVPDRQGDDGDQLERPSLLRASAGKSRRCGSRKGPPKRRCERRREESAWGTALTDTQLVMLSAAAQRNDHCLVAAPNVKAAAAQKIAGKLIASGLVKEIKAKPGAPVWRRDDEAGQSYAPKLTAAGAKAIAIDESAEPAHVADEGNSRENLSRPAYLRSGLRPQILHRRERMRLRLCAPPLRAAGRSWRRSSLRCARSDVATLAHRSLRLLICVNRRGCRCGGLTSPYLSIDAAPARTPSSQEPASGACFPSAP